MNFDGYQRLASRTAKIDMPEGILLANFGLGLGGEAGEVLDIIKKGVFHGHGVDPDKLGYELGDCLWYISQIAQLAGLSLTEIAQKNIEKLEKRYPNGFSPEASQKRVDTDPNNH